MAERLRRIVENSVGIRLREVQEEDLPIFFGHQQDRTACEMAAFTAKDPSDRAAFDAHWERILADPTVRAMTVVSDGKVVGNIGSFVFEGETEVTYWIDKAFWGGGIATEALRLFLSLQNIRPIYARSAADNAGSRRVLEKCGFQEVRREMGYANARGRDIEEIVFELR